MVTRYRHLLDTAVDNLATAHARRAHPATRAHDVPAPFLADLAGALAHLGATLGDTGPATRRLRTALTALAGADLDLSTPAADQVGGIAEDLAGASMAIRVAADLLASHGPTDQLTARQLAHDWAHPRPEQLASPAARQGAWTQLADLATLTAGLAAAVEHPLVAAAADRIAEAAANVPRAPADPHLQAAAPAWPLPLPRHPVPGEWHGRLEELAALAWRMTLPPDPGRTHPVDGLRLIAETGYRLHSQAARAAAAGGDPAHAAAMTGHAQLWARITLQLATLRTPTEPLMPTQHFALWRTRALAAGPLDAADLVPGRTVLAQAAAWATSTLERYPADPLVGMGPRLTPELRAGLRYTDRPDRQRHPYEQVLLDCLHGRTASPIPHGALDPLTALYRAAAQPPTTTPPPLPPEPRLRLATPAIAGRAGFPTPARPAPRSPGARR